MWKCKTFQSEWRAGQTAGGCGNSNQGKYFLIKFLNK
jgi:hypothetical protein